VLLIDTTRQRAAAAHAGWRGTVAGVARVALEALLALGSRPEHVQAALGPAIGPCCYEVGDELRPAFAHAFGSASAAFFHEQPGRRAHLDVRAANVRQLVAAGLPPINIRQLDECTRCRADLYPSYRRDGAQAGRMLSWVGWSAAR
jgi:YfiH family protein